MRKNVHFRIDSFHLYAGKNQVKIDILTWFFHREDILALQITIAEDAQ
jgi:hypothetical protein